MSEAARPRFPWVSTVLVMLAILVMLRLGFWQLERLRWKEGLIARYEAAETQTASVAWPQGAGYDDALYRRSSLDCVRTAQPSAIAGRNAMGVLGWAHLIRCDAREGPGGVVVLGWSSDPAPRIWAGGHVTGVIAPGGKGEARLVADPPLAGLAPNTRPNPRDLPNNHLSYAVQWFLFAATALVIYGLRLRQHLAPHKTP